MAIRITRFNEDGSIEVWHDDPGYNHGGAILEAEIKFATKSDGTDDLRFIVLKCSVPGCDGESVHPVSGGYDAEKVQEMFVRKLMKAPKKLPDLPSNAVRGRAEALNAAKKMAEEMGGPGRWKITE